jgi:hypothetical protein
VKHAWRTSLADSYGGIVRTEFIGTAPESFEIELAGGTLTVVRADRGCGGSRWLEGIEPLLEPARVLHITPHPFGEPLGPLRRALLQAVTRGQAPLGLSGEAGQSLDALLAGEGLDPDSSADLLRAWLTPDSKDGSRGAVLLDDANEIDADTLEILRRALDSAALPFRIVLRIAADEPIPPELATLPQGQAVAVPPLDTASATTLAVECTGGHWDKAEAERWAVRSGGLPLGVIESIRESLESGEVVWEEGRVAARLRFSGPAAPLPPKHWVRQRLRHQQDDAKRVLEALAVLGGRVEHRDLSDLLARRPGLVPDTDAAVAVLVASGWVQRMKPDVVALPSASHRDAVLSTLSDDEFRAWHRAASEAFSGRERPLATAAAVVHAVLAGEQERAVELGRLAAAATRAMGLERTADAFDRFVSDGDPRALEGRNLFTSQLEVARAVPSVWPERAAASVAPYKISSLPPGTDLGSAQSAAVDSASFRRSIPAGTVEALRAGDLEKVERFAEQLRVDEGRTALAERLEAMAHLARGETGDAIRRLREAADEARQSKSRDRCRASLALAVALAKAGRAEEALIESLDGLARARETSDTKGERACLRFLGHLATVAGHHDVAEAWASGMPQA